MGQLTTDMGAGIDGGDDSSNYWPGSVVATHPYLM